MKDKRKMLMTSYTVTPSYIDRLRRRHIMSVIYSGCFSLAALSAMMLFFVAPIKEKVFWPILIFSATSVSLLAVIVVRKNFLVKGKVLSSLILDFDGETLTQHGDGIAPISISRAEIVRIIEQPPWGLYVCTNTNPATLQKLMFVPSGMQGYDALRLMLCEGKVRDRGGWRMSPWFRYALVIGLLPFWIIIWRLVQRVDDHPVIAGAAALFGIIVLGWCTRAMNKQKDRYPKYSQWAILLPLLSLIGLLLRSIVNMAR